MFWLCNATRPSFPWLSDSGWSAQSRRKRSRSKARKVNFSWVASSTKKSSTWPLDWGWYGWNRAAPHRRVLGASPKQPVWCLHFFVLQRLQEEITKMSPTLERNALYIKSVSAPKPHSALLLCETLSLKRISPRKNPAVETQPPAWLLDCPNGSVFLQREGVCQRKSP